MGVYFEFRGMRESMGHESMESSCTDGIPREDLRALIDGLVAELANTAEATRSGHVPIAARADFLRAQDAYQRAVDVWGVASEQDQFDEAHDALAQCRSALAATRDRLRR